MKILLLGSSGFVGHNLFDYLCSNHELVVTTRDNQHYAHAAIFFDLLDPASWHKLLSFNVDVVINALAYGVVKTETSLDTMYAVNYFEMLKFYEAIRAINNDLIWIQLGTAFEYDLSASSISEATPCVPQTHYGISKLMFSDYLMRKRMNDAYYIIRPFGLFGAYEDSSKIIPALIHSQITKEPIALSQGDQLRDYSYIDNLSVLISILITNPSNYRRILNHGSGEVISLKQLSNIILDQFNPKDESLWQWGLLPKRPGEPDSFFSASGFSLSLIAGHYIKLEEGIKRTVDYYRQLSS